jgi:NADH-quinone oxidoreductase subunit E
MSHGPYIETRDSPTVAAHDGELGPREKTIPRDPHGSRIPGWDTPADLTKLPAGIPDLATTPVPEALKAEIDAAVTRYPDPRSAILPALWAAQRLHGWCSPTAVMQVAAVLSRTPAEIMAVATFYDQFETTEVGTHTIYVCTNISCSLNGADALLHKFEHETAGRESEFHVRGFECLGACDIAPMISIDGLFIGPIDVAEVEQILQSVSDGVPVFPARQINNRASVDPHAGTMPTHSASDTEAGEAAAEAKKSETANAGPGSIEGIQPDPKRDASVTEPSADPNNDDATSHRATGQDPDEDSA